MKRDEDLHLERRCVFLRGGDWERLQQAYSGGKRRSKKPGELVRELVMRHVDRIEANLSKANIEIASEDMDL